MNRKEQTLLEAKRILAQYHADLSERITVDGGPGSGNWGHSSVKGRRGGSAPGTGGAAHRISLKNGGFVSRKKVTATYRNAADSCEKAMPSLQKQWKKADKWNTEYEKYKSVKESCEFKMQWIDRRIREIEDEAKGQGNSPEDNQMYSTWVNSRDITQKTLDKATKEMERMEKNNELEKFAEMQKDYDQYATQRDEAVHQLFQSAADCKTAQEATDYLRASGYYFSYEGGNDSLYGRMATDRLVDLSQATAEHAVNAAVMLDRVFTDFPEAKGKLTGISCMKLPKKYDHTYGYAQGTRVVLNARYFGEGNKLKEYYERDLEARYHPFGTTPAAIIAHETTHAIEAAANAGGALRAADAVMREVNTGLYGKYIKNHEQEVRKKVSGYAADNTGCKITSSGKIKYNDGYGRNTEFLAEAIAEAENSPAPREVAVLAKKAFSDIVSARLK